DAGVERAAVPERAGGLAPQDVLGDAREVVDREGGRVWQPGLEHPRDVRAERCRMGGHRVAGRCREQRTDVERVARAHTLAVHLISTSRSAPPRARTSMSVLATSNAGPYTSRRTSTAAGMPARMSVTNSVSSTTADMSTP